MVEDTLINKSYKTYDYLSRYGAFPYYYNTKDNKYIYGTTSQLNASTTYTLHKVKQGETFDSIALDYYNNPTFFWVICDFNRIQDPYKELETGEVLKIPTLNAINYEG